MLHGWILYWINYVECICIKCIKYYYHSYDKSTLSFTKEKIVVFIKNNARIWKKKREGDGFDELSRKKVMMKNAI